MNKKSKDILLGFIPSLVLPLIFMFGFIYVKYDGTFEFVYVIKELLRVGQLSAILAVGAVPNLGLFFYALQKEKWQMGRGVMAATLVYGVLVMIFR